MADEYDESVIMTRYVWDHWRHLMTDVEQAAWSASIAEEVGIGYYKPHMTRECQKQMGLEVAPEVDVALADGISAFRTRVCDRLIRDYPMEAAFNRCPSCDRIVRTPKARQCFWCGHDWHDQSSAQP